jgi:hypothetical protein
MSGGHFNYDQYRMLSIADEIQLLIETNDSQELDRYGHSIGRNYKKEIIEKFKETEKLLRKTQILVQRIDWLVSGDDGEESFLIRLDKELSELDKELSELK